MDYFDTKKGVDEALFGRNEKDSGLYEYIFELSNIQNTDNDDVKTKKISHQVGIGFDGKKFIFARFAISHTHQVIKITKGSFAHQEFYLPLEFIYEIFDIESGIERLKILIRQREKISLSKETLLQFINPNQKNVRDCINAIYKSLMDNFDSDNPSNRVITLYNEWNRVFGVLYGEEKEQTDFVDYIQPLKKLYQIEYNIYPNLDMKKYLFSLQTYFNIVIKLLINNFLKQLINPEFEMQSTLKKSALKDLFEGKNEKQQNIISNFFEIHFYEWFVYTEKFDMSIIKSTIELINILPHSQLTHHNQQGT